MNKRMLLISALVISTLFCSCKSAQNVISDDEINTLLQGRNQIITVIEYDTLPFDTDDKITIDDFDYYRVIDENYDDWNEWTNYVKSVYTDEVAETIINNDKIIDIDGKTYTNDGGKGNNMSNEYTYDIISEMENMVTVSLKNTDNFSSEIIETEIILEKTSNGWRIKTY